MLSAKSHLQRTVHKHSQHAGVWKVLSEFLIRFYPDVGKTSASCARVCEHLDRSLDKVGPRWVASKAYTDISLD